jgi:hypothetical protein
MRGKTEGRNNKNNKQKGGAISGRNRREEP